MPAPTCGAGEKSGVEEEKMRVCQRTCPELAWKAYTQVLYGKLYDSSPRVKLIYSTPSLTTG